MTSMRRVARFARRALLVVGVLLLTWVPVSYFVTADSRTVVGSSSAIDAFVMRGLFVAAVHTAPGVAWESVLRVDVVPGAERTFTWFWLPTVNRFAFQATRTTLVRLPLWQLALLALAWPAAAFVAKRRRARRGFAVEPAIPPPPLPPGEGGESASRVRASSDD